MDRFDKKRYALSDEQARALEEVFWEYIEHDVKDYVGELVNGKRHGQGAGTLADGKKYFGEWAHGSRHGQGIATWPDGQQYVGEWSGDLATGNALLSKPDGSTYVGQFVDSQRHGYGVQTFASGAKYVGQWKDDHPEGQGVHISPEGKQHIGKFAINQRHGWGVRFFENGVNDDNNKMYWESGELMPQSEWFKKDEAQRFEWLLKSLDISILESDGLSREEKIHIVSELHGDGVANVPGMRAVGLYLVNYVMGVFQSDILNSVGHMKDLLQNEETLDAFCKGKHLPDVDRDRLMRWASWSKSRELAAIVDCLTRGTEGVGEQVGGASRFGLINQ